MEGVKVFETIENSIGSGLQARFEIHHVSAGRLGPCFDFVGPGCDILHLRGIEQAADHEKAVTLKICHLGRGEYLSSS